MKLNNILYEQKYDRVGYIMMGAPGAGKGTWVRENLNSADFRIINPDDINASLYSGTIKDMTKSFQRAVAWLDRTLPTGMNFILDVTGSDPKKLKDYLNKATEQGYKLHLVYIDVAENTAIKQAEKRYEAGGRYIPARAISYTWKKVRESYAVAKRYNWQSVKRIRQGRITNLY